MHPKFAYYQPERSKAFQVDSRAFILVYLPGRGISRALGEENLVDLSFRSQIQDFTTLEDLGGFQMDLFAFVIGAVENLGEAGCANGHRLHLARLGL